MSPKIFSVLDFHATELGRRKVLLHFVAGMSSAEAEASFRASRLPVDEAFILTDSAVDMNHAPALFSFVSDLRGEEISEENYLRWVEVMTCAVTEEGDPQAPVYRRI